MPRYIMEAISTSQNLVGYTGAMDTLQNHRPVCLDRVRPAENQNAGIEGRLEIRAPLADHKERGRPRRALEGCFGGI